MTEFEYKEKLMACLVYKKWQAVNDAVERLLRRVSDGRGGWWDEPREEAWWLVNQMDAYCCGYNEVEYNGKWYYTVHHA